MKYETKDGTIYSFRAEVTSDAVGFVQACLDAGLTMTVHIVPESIMGIPTAKVEFATSADLEKLRAIMRTFPDGHVMLETLRQCPLAENSLERDDID